MEQLRVILRLQLPGDVRRLVAGPGLQVHSECIRVDGVVLADSRHFRVTSRRPSLCRQLTYHCHQTDRHWYHPAGSATDWTVSTTTSQVLTHSLQYKLFLPSASDLVKIETCKRGHKLCKYPKPHNQDNDLVNQPANFRWSHCFVELYCWLLWHLWPFTTLLSILCRLWGDSSRKFRTDWNNKGKKTKFSVSPCDYDPLCLSLCSWLFISTTYLVFWWEIFRKKIAIMKYFCECILLQYCVCAARTVIC